MKARTVASMIVAMLTALPAAARAQNAGYPMIVIPTGKGPFTFPPGYTTPWDKVAR